MISIAIDKCLLILQLINDYCIDLRFIINIKIDKGDVASRTESQETR